MSCNSIQILVNKCISIPYFHNKNGISSIRIVIQFEFLFHALCFGSKYSQLPPCALLAIMDIPLLKTPC